MTIKLHKLELTTLFDGCWETIELVCVDTRTPKQRAAEEILKAVAKLGISY